MSKEIDSEEVYEDDTPELEQADALEDYDAVEDEKQAAKNTEESDKDTEDAQDEVSKKKKIRGIIAELCLYAAIIIVCGVFVPRYVIQRTIVDGKVDDEYAQRWRKFISRKGFLSFWRT